MELGFHISCRIFFCPVPILCIAMSLHIDRGLARRNPPRAFEHLLHECSKVFYSFTLKRKIAGQCGIVRPCKWIFFNPTECAGSSVAWPDGRNQSLLSLQILVSPPTLNKYIILHEGWDTLSNFAPSTGVHQIFSKRVTDSPVQIYRGFRDNCSRRGSWKIHVALWLWSLRSYSV